MTSAPQRGPTSAGGLSGAGVQRGHDLDGLGSVTPHAVAISLFLLASWSDALMAGAGFALGPALMLVVFLAVLVGLGATALGTVFTGLRAYLLASGDRAPCLLLRRHRARLRHLLRPGGRGVAGRARAAAGDMNSCPPGLNLSRAPIGCTG